MILHRKIIWISFITLLGLIGLAAVNPQPPWVSCYDKKTNAIHFQALGKKIKNGNSCMGKTKYDASGAFKLIENVNVKEGFGEARAGTKRQVVLKNGRRLLVSQWSGLGKSNQILVLEPDLASNRVTRHCNIENFSNAFSTRFDRRTGKLMVLVVKPKDSKLLQYKKTWQSCEI